MRSIVILMLIVVSTTLTGCVALIVPSPSQLYHKDNVYVGTSIGYGNILQAEANTWVSKQHDVDIGLAVCRYSETSYSSLSFSPYIRYWIKSKDTPFLNLGGSLIIATGSFDGITIGGTTVSGRGFSLGPSFFVSVGYFGEVFSISLTTTGSAGYSQVFDTTISGSGYYLFGSLSLQMNLMPIRNVGIGAEISPGLGVGSGTVLLPAPARLMLNFTF